MAEDQKAEHETPEDLPPEQHLSRRAIVGTLGTIVGAAALASSSKPAKADISPGDLFEQMTRAIQETIQEPIDITAEVLQNAMRIARASGIPAVFIRLINQLLELLADNPDTLLIPTNVESAMALSWPDDIPAESAMQGAQALINAEATKRRTSQTQRIVSTAAASQGEMGIADAELVAASMAAASAGRLIECIHLNSCLTATVGQRLSMMIANQAAVTQQTSDQTYQDKWQRTSMLQDTERANDVPEVLGIRTWR